MERSAFSLISTPVALSSWMENFHPIDPAIFVLAQHELQSRKFWYLHSRETRRCIFRGPLIGFRKKCQELQPVEFSETLAKSLLVVKGKHNPGVEKGQSESRKGDAWRARGAVVEAVMKAELMSISEW
jgi:hypothetical protein